jgi:phage terminase large subunit-like protein
MSAKNASKRSQAASVAPIPKKTSKSATKTASKRATAKKAVKTSASSAKKPLSRKGQDFVSRYLLSEKEKLARIKRDIERDTHIADEPAEPHRTKKKERKAAVARKTTKEVRKTATTDPFPSARTEIAGQVHIAVAQTRGERVIAFIESFCIVPEGDGVGAMMKLSKFQHDFILDIYDNPHGTHTAILSIARKNGKTGLIAAILLAHICGPEARQNSQIVSGAQSKDQAAVVFELARKMVELSPALSKVVRVQPSGKRLYGIRKNVLYRALAAEGKTAHGLSPILAILDELGQVAGPVDPFVTAITTAQGAYEDALLIIISTQAPTDADMLSILIDAQIESPDPHVVLHLHTAPIDCALDDPDAWSAANPALGEFRSRADVERQARKAIDIPTQESEFRNLILNQRVEAVQSFVSKSVWDACADWNSGSEYDDESFYGGLDLASVSDLTAFMAVGSKSGNVHSTFWLPEDGLREKSKNDRVPYETWKDQGFLYTTPGKAVEYSFIAKFLKAFCANRKVVKIGFDRYLMRFLKPWLLHEGFSERQIEEVFVEFGQGTASMTPALREFEAKLLTKKLHHNSHPILNMCSHNAKVIGDSGARKFDKRKARGRIDGMVALAMAVGVMPMEVKDAEPSLFFV